MAGVSRLRLSGSVLASAALGTAFGWAGWFAVGLVVAGGVQGEVADDFAGVGVDDGDVEVVVADKGGSSGLLSTLGAVSKQEMFFWGNVVTVRRSWPNAEYALAAKCARESVAAWNVRANRGK